jgi:hypothetical protein
MNLTSNRASGARSWMIACVLASALMALVFRGTNNRNQPQETLIDAGNVATPRVTGGYVHFLDWGGGLHKLNARKVSEYAGWSDSVSRSTPVWADGVLVVAQQPQSFAPSTTAPICWAWSPEQAISSGGSCWTSIRQRCWRSRRSFITASCGPSNQVVPWRAVRRLPMAWNSPAVHQSVGNDTFYAFGPVALPETSRLNDGR